MRSTAVRRMEETRDRLVAEGTSRDVADGAARAEVSAWLKEREAELDQRYERELMNPREALSLGSISRLVWPGKLREALGKSMGFLMRHYQPGPFVGPQREFH